MNLRIPIRNLMVVLTNIFIMSLLFLLLKVNYNAVNYSTKGLCLVSLAVLVYILLSWRFCRRKLTNPVIWFIIFYFICIFGQVFIRFVFEIQLHNFFDVLKTYSISEINDAIILSTLSMLGIATGALFFNRRINKDTYQKDNLNIVKYFAWFLLIIAFIPGFYYYLNDLQNVLQGGYKAVYSDASFGYGSILKRIGNLLPLSLMMLMVVNKSKNLFILGILFSGSQMLFGNRGLPILEVFTFLLLYNFYVKKINRKNILQILLSSYIVLYLFTVIRSYRNISLRDWIFDSTVWHSILIEKNPIIEVVYELGTAIAPTISAINLFPDVINFQYGSTFFYTIISSVPDFFGIRPEHIEKFGNIITIIAEKQGSAFGGSFVAEVFSNFGWVTPVFMILGGYLIAAFAQWCFKDKTIVLNVLAWYLMVNLLWIIRNSTATFANAFTYAFIFPLVIYWLFKKVFVQKKARLGIPTNYEQSKRDCTRI
jgi:hypothetical protein